MVSILDLAICSDNVYQGAKDGYTPGFHDKVIGEQTTTSALKRGQFRNNLYKTATAALSQSDLPQTPLSPALEANMSRCYLDLVVADKATAPKKDGLPVVNRQALYDEVVKRTVAAKERVQKFIECQSLEDAGMYAATYERTGAAGGKIIAFRGTEPLGFNGDLTQDVMLFSTYNKQFYAAVRFTQSVLRVNQWKVSDLHLTGHSLGGALAKYVAFTLIKSGERPAATITFNAPGISAGFFSKVMVHAASGRGYSKPLDRNRPDDRGDLAPGIEFEMAGDAVSKVGRQLLPYVRVDAPKSVQKLGKRNPLARHSMGLMVDALRDASMGNVSARATAMRFCPPPKGI